jgi:hypothetical protein
MILIDGFWVVMYNQVCDEAEGQVNIAVENRTKRKIWSALRLGILWEVKIAVMTEVLHSIRKGDSFMKEEDKEVGLATL